MKYDHGFGKLLYSFVSFVHPKNDLGILGHKSMNFAKVAEV